MSDEARQLQRSQREALEACLYLCSIWDAIYERGPKNLESLTIEQRGQACLTGIASMRDSIGEALGELNQCRQREAELVKQLENHRAMLSATYDSAKMLEVERDRLVKQRDDEERGHLQTIGERDEATEAFDRGRGGAMNKCETCEGSGHTEHGFRDCWPCGGTGSIDPPAEAIAMRQMREWSLRFGVIDIEMNSGKYKVQAWYGGDVTPKVAILLDSLAEAWSAINAQEGFPR